jgi:hypothetical protein
MISEPGSDSELSILPNVKIILDVKLCFINKNSPHVVITESGLKVPQRYKDEDLAVFFVL